MVGSKKKLVSKANTSWLGGSMALWKEHLTDACPEYKLKPEKADFL